MSFPKYEKYKDSGVEWLGEVPEGWDVDRVKNIFMIGRGRVISNEEAKEDGSYPVFSSQTTNDGCLGYIETFDFDCDQLTWTTDGANAGTVFLRRGKHNCTNVCGTLQIKDGFNYNLRFGLYFLTFATQFYKRPDTNGAKIMNGEMAVIVMVVPTTFEQGIIAEFLDRETAKIDELVAEQQRLIEVLKEKRQAVISHAVTRGLNPNVKLKPSGIEWLGDVPEHWEFKRLKYLGEAITGLTYSPTDIVEDNIRGTHVLRSSNVQGGVITFDDNVFVSAAIPEDLITQIGDILICSRNGSRALIGKNATIDEKSAGLTFGAFMTVFRSKHSAYLSCILNSPLFEFQSGAFMTSTINQLTIGVLNNFEVPLPPENEREDIAVFLAIESAKFDALIAGAQHAIDLLQERRTALISAAVTGKIDVRQLNKN